MSSIYASSFLRQAVFAARPLRTARTPAHNIARMSNRSSRHALYSTQSEAKVQDSSSSSSEKKDDSDKGSDAGAPSSGEEECLKKLKAKEDEVVDLTSRLRYLQADFLNLQRNAAREKEQTRDFAISRFAGDLLETVDVLALALKSVPSEALSESPEASSSTSSSGSSSSSSSSSTDASTSTSSSTPSKSPAVHLRELHTGVEMTHRLLLSTLFKYGVAPFDPTGEHFDPHRHEALYQAPVPGVKPGTVLECQKTGFTIKDRTLRAAQVGVAAESQ